MSLTSLITKLLLILLSLFKRGSNKSLLEAKDDIYDSLNVLKSKIKCERVILIYTKNGSGRPSIGKQLSITVNQESWDSDSGLTPLRKTWRDRSTDGPYVKLLLRLTKKGILHVKTDEIQGILRTVYESQGIQQSILAEVVTLDGHYNYLSCNYTSDKEITEEDLLAVQNTAHRIRYIISGN